MAENWYIILELEFDPHPVQDIAVINQRIDEKIKFWASKFNDFSKGAEYRKYHQMQNDIRNTMSDPEKRKILIMEACEITYGPIDKLIKMIGRKGDITQDELQNIAGRQKVDVAVVESRRVSLGIKKGENKGVNFQAIYDKYYKSKPQNASTFDGLKPLLNSFGADNLYSFLFADTPTKNMDKLPCHALRQKAGERKKNEFNKTDSISGSGSKLCGQCELSFKDDNSKNIYDSYLEYTRRKAVLDEAKGIADISGELSTEQGDIFIGQLTELFKDRKLASDVLTAFCKVERISYNPKESGGMAKNLSICRACGCTNDVATGRTVCQSCGEELYIKCPKCGNTNEANIKVCKCGFKFENIDKAIALCNLAEQSIEAMDFAVAEAHLSDAERYWPGSAKTETLRNRLSTLALRLRPLAESMRAAVSERRYFEAQKQYANIKKMSPDFKDSDLEKEILAAIDTATAVFKQAQAAKTEKDIIDLCVKAYEICKDYPGVKELIPPPLPPANLNVTADGNTKVNILSWDRSASTGTVFYTVLRKKDAVPVNMNDGELLGQVSACGFTDNKIEPGVSYFYSVFAQRAGTQSKPLLNNLPIVNLFEISNLTITAGESLLQLEWDVLPADATAEIYRRTDAGREEKISATVSRGFLDSGLINGTSYSYTVKLSYNVNGRCQTTRGATINGIPTKPPKPIDLLTVKPEAGDTFSAVWSNPENMDVELYCSTTKPTFNYGDIISQQIIDNKMRRLALNRINKTTATFQYKGDELLYIVATVIKSGSVIFGATARASKGETVKLNKIAAVNDKINIYLDVPPGATGFVVLYRFDKYPEDIGDVKTVRKYIPLKQYQHYSALVLDTLEPQNYYFSVFAEFTRDGDKDYSIGADYLFANMPKQIISYSISVSKKLFGESSVTVEFEADSKTFDLPDLEIMSATGSAPMFKASAMLFDTVKAQTVSGSYSIRIPIPKNLPNDTYIKAFLKDESLASNYQLKLKLKSNCKIT